MSPECLLAAQLTVTDGCSGMARIFTAAPGLVKLMGGSTWAETQLPEVYQITPARVQRLRKLLADDDELQSRL